MPLPDDVYRVIHAYTVYGQQCLNVYHYQVGDAALDPNSDWQTLLTAFNTGAQSAIVDIQQNQTKWQYVEAINLNNDTDYGVIPLTLVTGSRSGELEPAFMCWTFRLNRQSRQFRNGRKAIAGVSEGDHIGDNADPLMATAIGDAEAFLGSALTDSLGTVFYPIIARFVPGQSIPIATNLVTSATFVRVSTQNTRKR